MTESEPSAASPVLQDLVHLAPTDIVSPGGLSTLLASLDADVDVGLVDPRVELRRLPRALLKWSLVSAAAQRRVSEVTMEREDLHARLDAAKRHELTESKVRFTEAMVTAAIDSDPRWHAQLKALHEAQARARVAADILEILRIKKDLVLAELQTGGFAGDAPALAPPRA